ncbi:MAG TPA: VCBS repeat-containing protein, partial [Flavitalea sp.]|nr:VCBS repeat-containing protein [Flavitalea sp.]
MIPSSQSGINFNNVVIESDSINPLDMEYLYNGGGVAIGDFNNDNRPDIYFTASQTDNKLYINKGDFVFEDITDAARVTGEGRWCNGAAVVDINNDGLNDIYVCATIKNKPEERTNLLYINQGNDKSGIPLFKEMATQYNLADTGFSVQAAFLDYDRDGDLDVYVATTSLAQRNSSRFDRN